ncbi:methylmalonyl Co-A mutase-associated GTPase MeaB [Corynebacterium sp. 153RC1]|uniref:methylmalonyl Co-A mutase-associated GTPase MeaB n=1 Tax=unclassified Corynebacterium TaxID=2624378 RepID=UPI00211C8E5C|nr:MULTISPECIES: methylmalonyl Co-A mutase-associated GTPase MeaB [unclassified Corynebacterium]MCQ9369759.1 methylmalonyl Co-A mutase-associated GTPase MeaB [Corynebacterium sp. 35RC1]MCQ9352418.1 methylmalonyl Co-A mutase-associated GTPase MeaB [Corynebacterium sp. 209RC1]MCQ9354410.1 methylmalonyl Co-A mutase-associated GTPase MeaB [Corynebacterium sp. 1222RC1]MCQ9356701.1 methylmalonyl Co-A mutase-associated GTPase MeaB [Corynebacterium sp. 122RC1]MCQ9358805.1 methylmalonyl Co-A mutase-ass
MNEFLEHHLGSLLTTAGTDLGEATAVAPEVIKRARRRIDIDELFEGVRSRNRTLMSRAITLLESTAPAHRVLAQELLVRLLPFSGNALRVGITGVPGVGKSTFIEALGMKLINDGHKVAVLAIDPSSTKTRGSILGDKTRMAKLAREDDAFIRPSPSAGTLGGVAKATRESMVVFEAAGYDVILVETVGVGQSEVAVSQMVDCFTFLALAGAGDQLQGIKKGVLEMADLIAINKADGPNLKNAKRAARELAAAMRMVRQEDALWHPPTITISAIEHQGIDDFWQVVQDHHAVMLESGRFEHNRREQQVQWMWSMVHETLLQRLNTNPDVISASKLAERQLRDAQITPTLAAQRVLDAFDGVTTDEGGNP